MRREGRGAAALLIAALLSVGCFQRRAGNDTASQDSTGESKLAVKTEPAPKKAKPKAEPKAEPGEGEEEAEPVRTAKAKPRTAPPPTPEPPPRPAEPARRPPASDHPVPWEGELTSFRARLSAADHKASDGFPLKAVGMIIQQDRANYHRFAKRDAEDTSDDVFADQQARAKLANAEIAGQPDLLKEVLNGAPLVDVHVFSGARGYRLELAWARH